MKIAVVEDEKKIAQSLKYGLEAEGYVVSNYYDGISGEAGIKNFPHDLIILDLMLPGKDGIEVCRALRERGIGSPILVLTAKDTLEDKLKVFDNGADDFVAKPFSFEELLARLKALSRRTNQSLAPKIALNDFILDYEQRKFFRGGKEISLTFTEFELLRYLFLNINTAKTRKEIFNELWHRDDENFSNVVDVHVRNLRKKIDEGYSKKLLRTVHGTGYAIQV